MTVVHCCSHCGHTFKITHGTRLKTALGFQYFPLPFVLPSQAIDDYQKVRCPDCGHVDREEKLRMYGIFPPRTFVILAISAILMMLLLDVMGNW